MQWSNSLTDPLLPKHADGPSSCSSSDAKAKAASRSGNSAGTARAPSGNASQLPETQANTTSSEVTGFDEELGGPVRIVGLEDASEQSLAMLSFLKGRSPTRSAAPGAASISSLREGGSPQSVATGSSVPPSFKSTKARKTKSFIGSVKNSTRLSMPECRAESIDPRLEDDGDIQHILQKVATLILGHVQDGQEASPGSPPGDADDEFHEKHFLVARCRCFPCPCPRRQKKEPLTTEKVLTLISDTSQSLYFCKQIVVLMAIYLERLLAYSGTRLTLGNWRSIVVAALMIASKVWEDVHPWNADFEDCMEDVAGMKFQCRALYRLESLFLDRVQWRVFVDGEVYAAYFFALLEDRKIAASGDGSAPPRRRRERLNSTPLPIFMESIREDLLEDMVDMEDASSEADRTMSSMATDRMMRELTPSMCHHHSSHLGFMNDGSEGRPHGARIMHKAWLLDKTNPLVGAFRHAPRALAPSRHIRSSENLLWEHKLAARTVEVLGPKRTDNGKSNATLSGATGSQLASELRRYLDSRGSRSGASPEPAGLTQGASSSSMAEPESGSLSSLRFE